MAKKFTDAFKKEVVRDSKSLGIAESADLHKVSKPTIYKWLGEAKGKSNLKKMGRNKKDLSETKIISHIRDHLSLLKKPKCMIITCEIADLPNVLKGIL